MPSLIEIKKTNNKKFVKKPYRIWNLSGEIATPDHYNKPDKEKKGKTVEKNPIKQSDNNQTTVEQQSDNSRTTIRQQSGNSRTTVGQQSDNNRTTIRQPIRQQGKVDQGIEHEEGVGNRIEKLSGLQEKLFYLILEYCNFSGELKTDQLITNKVAKNIGCSYKSAKTTIERLVKKAIINRLKGKSSKIGFVHFEITKEGKIIGNRLKLQKENLNGEFKEYITKIRQQLDNTSDNGANSSSSFNIKKTTTNNLTISEEWSNIDINPLTPIGFTGNHLHQIASQNKLTIQIVQDSIYAFAFDIEKNNKTKSIKGDPINFFMGILRKGDPYIPPSNYESPRDKSMRLYHEKMQKLEHEREAREKESKELAYKDWFSKLTDNQKRGFLPENMRRKENIGKSKFLEGSAKTHFYEEVWPCLKKEIEEAKN